MFLLMALMFVMKWSSKDWRERTAVASEPVGVAVPWCKLTQSEYLINTAKKK